MQHLNVFDVDGVITDPATSEVSTDVLTRIAADLSAGNATAFNTGRPYEWVDEKVLSLLQERCSPADLNHLLVVAEMGGVVCGFSEGKMHIELDETLSLPGAFITDVQHMLEQTLPDGTRLSEYAWWDGLKRTMGSLVKWDHVDLDEFNRIRPELDKGLKALLGAHGLDDFMLGHTTIAVDIQHKTAGKHKGADQVLAWLAQRGEQPQTFAAFGDSVSDKAMAETFAATGRPTTFVFVGDVKHTEDVQDPSYATVVTGGGFSHDTATYLAQHESAGQK